MNLVYRLGWLSFNALFATYFRWRVFHAERVPMTGPVLLAANHASYIDPPLVGSPVRRPINFLARDDLFRVPLAAWLLRQWRVVPVDRERGGASGITTILSLLQRGEAVVLFPEGTRSPDGQLQKAKSGVGLIVAKSDAPVVPVRVFGTYEAWSRRHRFPRPGRMMVAYGEPMHFERLREEARNCSKARLKEIYQEITDQIMAAIGRLEPE